MNYHIDRRVILSQDSEHKGLYDWLLKEVDRDGNQVGFDQIPWPWSLSFTARDLVLTEALVIISGTRPNDDSGDANTERTVQRRQSIRATLLPLKAGHFDRTEFSMFGTSRLISKFELYIYELQATDGEEKCVATGNVSYTYENDFDLRTTDDAVAFNLFVRSDTFARYAKRVSASSVDEVVLQLGGVSGFYSEWSPSISAYSIKVLTDSQEQKVQTPEDCSIRPPRLGEVVETNLYFHRVVRLEQAEAEKARVENDESVAEPLEAEPEPASELDEPPPVAEPLQTGRDRVPDEVIPAAAPVRSGQLKVVDEQVIGLLSSLRFAAWGIAFLLLLLLFK